MTEEKTKIKFEDFSKLDLRVAEILEVEEVENADKLFKLKIDVGELGKRTLVAGIKQNYSKEDLKGKKIIIIANLEPRKLKGVESEGMLLAACDDNRENIVLLGLDKNIMNGSKIS